MAPKTLLLALGAIAAATPAVLVAQPDTGPIVTVANGTAPAGTPTTKYCMHVDPITGRLAETTECWTREEWAEQGVDVDKEWAKEGIRTLG